MHQKFFTALFLIFSSSLYVFGQDVITILSEEFQEFTGTVDMSIEIDDVIINFDVTDAEYSSIDFEESFSFAGSIEFDFSNLENIDSVYLDYRHNCIQCFEVEFENANGEIIAAEDLSFNGELVYDEDVPLAKLTMGGLIAIRFEELRVYMNGVSSSITTDINARQLSILPNPTSNAIQISAPFDLETFSGTVINAAGQTVQSFQALRNNDIIRLDELGESGLYFIRLFNDEEGLMYNSKVILR